MKSLFLICWALIVAQTGMAQVVLSSGNLPVIGKKYIWANGDFSKQRIVVDADAHGWDFSGIPATNFSEQLYESTSILANNPVGIAQLSGKGYFQGKGTEFYRTDARGMHICGFVGDFRGQPNTNVLFSPAIPMIETSLSLFEPTTYSSYWSAKKSGNSQAYDSLFEGSIETHIEADQVGELKTPYAVYSEAVRLKISKKSSVISIIAAACTILKSEAVITTTHTYQYWVKGIAQPVCEVVCNATNQPLKVVFLKADQPDSKTSDKLIVPAFYPNPVCEIVHVNNQSSQPGAIQIFNAEGKLLKSNPLLPGQNEVDLKNLKSGIYFYSITSGDVKTNGRFLKE